MHAQEIRAIGVIDTHLHFDQIMAVVERRESSGVALLAFSLRQKNSPSNDLLSGSGLTTTETDDAISASRIARITLEIEKDTFNACKKKEGAVHVQLPCLACVNDAGRLAPTHS